MARARTLLHDLTNWLRCVAGRHDWKPSRIFIAGKRVDYCGRAGCNAARKVQASPDPPSLQFIYRDPARDTWYEVTANLQPGDMDRSVDELIERYGRPAMFHLKWRVTGRIPE